MRRAYVWMLKEDKKVKGNKIAHVKDVDTVNLKGTEMTIGW